MRAAVAWFVGTFRRPEPKALPKNVVAEVDDGPLSMRGTALTALGYGSDIPCPSVAVPSGNDVDED